MSESAELFRWLNQHAMEREERINAWSDSIDPATIPDAVLKIERARRNSAKRKTYGAGSGRPKVMRPCPKCRKKFSATDLRRHHC